MMKITDEFKNEYLSYSRVNGFERCPLSFKLHYIDKLESKPAIAPRFGKALHGVLERLVGEHIEAGRPAVLSGERAGELWQEEWKKENLMGIPLFYEGLEILEEYIQWQGVVDPREILSLEQEISLDVGPYKIKGYIDRVNKLDHETVEIVDYKSNRMLYTRDELSSNLQLSIYAVAAQRLYPWAKNIKLTMAMLRHQVEQTTTRSQWQLDAAMSYVETIARMTETQKEFWPTLGNLCPYCDHHEHCPAYKEALLGRTTVEKTADLEDIEAVARERKEVAKLSRILYARKSELDAIIKDKVKADGEFVAAGTRYRMFNNTRVEYPIRATLDVLCSQGQLDRADAIERIVKVDNKAVEALVKELGTTLNRTQAKLLKAELKTLEKRTFSPRLWAKEVTA